MHIFFLPQIGGMKIMDLKLGGTAWGMRSGPDVQEHANSSL